MYEYGVCTYTYPLNHPSYIENQGLQFDFNMKFS